MSFRFVTGDNNGVIYAVTDDGDLLYYRDLARDGTAQWANGGGGQKIGSGWQNFLTVFCGGDGVIYADFATSYGLSAVPTSTSGSPIDN